MAIGGTVRVFGLLVNLTSYYVVQHARVGRGRGEVGERLGPFHSHITNFGNVTVGPLSIFDVLGMETDAVDWFKSTAVTSIMSIDIYYIYILVQSMPESD